MNRLGTALLAAVEGIVTVGVGVGIALVPLTLLWGFEYGLQIDWDVFWKATGSVWLVGHGVDVSFLLGPALAKSSGVSGAAAPVHVTLAALGFALVTAWLGARAGRRFAETEHRTTGLLVGTAVVALLGLAVALSATSAVTSPTLWQAIVLPALWFGIPALAASEVCRHRRGQADGPVAERVLALTGRIPAVWRDIAAFGLRAGTAASAMVVAVAGVLVTLLLFSSFAEVITLYERSHAGVVGGIALTVGQLAFLPDFVGWATSWIIGPGFAIGTGSSVSPVATVLGPIPALPVFGALPSAGHAFGLVWVLVPVLAGFAAGGLLRPRLVRALGTADSALHRALGGVATGLVGGVLMGFVAWVSSGSFGPGRLADVGPHALAVGGFAALEIGVPAIVALAVGSDLVRMPERSWPRDRWTESPETGPVDREGSLLAALDQAGAGRTTDVHRFVVEEAHAGSSTAGPRDARDARDGRDVDVTSPSSDAATAPVDHTDVDHTDLDHTDLDHADLDHTDVDHTDVDLPAWARTDAVAAERVTGIPDHTDRGRGTGLRARLRGAADGVRDRAGDLRDRVTGAGDGTAPGRTGTGGSDAARNDAGLIGSAPGSGTSVAPGSRTEGQPAFPWSTEEFVAGRDDADDERVGQPPVEPRAAAPAPSAPRWDATDQIPDDELPWWRRPKHDGQA
ncbi:DUF6350 family protein [Curtobacterium sp. ISL-83]|uniref:cell division protein PerM n=1 Tax=Curtobacterium sp. ISL-83 TaxID=2819145 RepID=UPI001BE5D069|nr:DUF6350 family protein [Curtobacterium sp. ISL-83]MBT2501862.1 hypothetical protein [Curtobacterium sp. ISL-83]